MLPWIVDKNSKPKTLKPSENPYRDLPRPCNDRRLAPDLRPPISLNTCDRLCFRFVPTFHFVLFLRFAAILAVSMSESVETTFHTTAPLRVLLILSHQSHVPGDLGGTESGHLGLIEVWLPRHTKSGGRDEVLQRLLWKVSAWFQAEFSAERENSNSVGLEDTKASRCGLDCLDAAG